nr:ROK family protein [Aestuariimicrobium kwangyangense]
MSIVLGIDIGGSGIKGAPVDLETGDFAADRLRIDTPAKSTPGNVADVVAQIVDHFADQIGDAPIGLTVPAPVVHGHIPMIANLHQDWKGLEAETFFAERLGRPITVVNDADAAGVAEVHHGAAKGVQGLVILTTQGTGIGSAIINNGILIPNSEFGHLEIDGHDAESRAAASIKDKEGLSYRKWATERLQRYYEVVEALMWPDLFVVGGGVSKDHEKFIPLLKLRTPMIPAVLRNKAGIIGAATLAQQRVEHPDTAPVLPHAENRVVDED